MGFFDFIFGSITKGGRGSVSSETERKIKHDWEQIDLALTQRSPSSLRQALITADRSLDFALRDFAEGDTMGERLKATQQKFDKYLYNGIWEAHKLRNSLVHEAGFEPTHFVIKEKVEIFRNALRTLGIKI